MGDTIGWEFAYVQMGAVGAMKGMAERLNDLGVEGWELVSMDDRDRTFGTNVTTAMLKRRLVPLDPPPDFAQGWYADASGRYDKRYWNGRAWTFHVGREADKSVHRDPPTTLTPTPDMHQ